MPDGGKARAIGRFLFSYRGRMGNASYILYQLALAPFVRAFYRMLAAVKAEDFSGGLVPVTMILGFLIIWSYTAVLSRRMHDFGFSGKWWIAPVLMTAVIPKAPWIAGILLAFVPGARAANRYGPPPWTLKRFFMNRRLGRLGSEFSKGKMSAEEFNRQRDAILAEFPAIPPSTRPG